MNQEEKLSLLEVELAQAQADLLRIDHKLHFLHDKTHVGDMFHRADLIDERTALYIEIRKLQNEIEELKEELAEENRMHKRINMQWMVLKGQ